MAQRSDEAGRIGEELREPVDEEYVGSRDLTRWSRAGGWLVHQVVVGSRFVSAHTVLVLASLLGAGLVTALTVASAEIYESVKESDGLSGLDGPALRLAISLRTPGSVDVVRFFTDLGGQLYLSLIVVLVLVAMTLRWRSRTPVILMLIGVAGSLSMTVAGKDLVGRTRPPRIDAVPPYETSPSFPSGHTLNSTVVASLVAYLLLLHLTSSLARVLAVAGAVAWFLAMGLSRVFLGHHWLTDVAAGWTLGLAWVVLVISAHRLFLTVRRHRQRSARAARPAVEGTPG